MILLLRLYHHLLQAEYGISVVFYFEPVEIIRVIHRVEGSLINTEKNIGQIRIPTVTKYDISSKDFSPKEFQSLNKNFWPGYILTGYKVYSASSSNLIASRKFDVNTTTKMNSKNDAKRSLNISTAITSLNDLNDLNASIINKEKIGFGKDKIIVFEYMYPEVEIKNVDYKNNKIIKDASGQNIHYKMKLIGDNMIVESLDTSAIQNNALKELEVTLSNGVSKKYRYDASNYSLVQTWIYTKDLNKNSLSLYKVIVGGSEYAPSNIANDKILNLNDISGYANGYILNTEELLAVMNKVWSDLYIEFRYFEGANKVDVSYVDDEGNVLMPPETYKMLETLEDKKFATVPVIEIEGYKLIKYVLDGEVSTKVNDMDELKIFDIGEDRKLIFVYKKEDGENSNDDPTYVPEIPYAIIRSNDRDDEEYDIEIAMPSDEDVYANVVTDSYRLEEAFSIMKEKQSVNVILKKRYYQTNNDNDEMITSNIAVATATKNIVYDFEYEYFGGGNAKLFILENAVIENDAIFDKGHYDTNGKVFMEADYNNEEPMLEYVKGGVLKINNSDECMLVKNENGVYFLEIMLDGIDYEKPDMNSLATNYQTDHSVIDEKIRKNATVNGDLLSVYAENQKINYLDGLDKDISIHRLFNVSELASAGYYNNTAKAPLSNRDVLYNNRNVFTFEHATNREYETSRVTINYVLSEEAGEDEKNMGASDDVLKRTFTYTKDDILMNDVNIYTPIVNYMELIPLDNSGENHNQMIDDTKKNVLTLDSVFSIEIPHGGMHVYAQDNLGTPYLGYGDKDYNFDGVMNKDEGMLQEKGLKRANFAKQKLVKFDFDVYAILYDEKGNVRDSHLILENTWFDLGMLNKKTGLCIEKYNFIIPVWVKDNEEGNVTVRIIASNMPNEYDAYTLEEVEYISKDVSNEKEVYVLEKDFEVFIAGSVYDLQIRDSDDIGWSGKLSNALKIGNTSQTKNLYLPIGQFNQNLITAYKYGLKLGYRFFFDLKTKGVASEEVTIKPTFYYVSKDGGIATDDISIFYDTEKEKYIKLTENPIEVKMRMNNTRGTVNNSDFNFELIRGKILNPETSYTAIKKIGDLFVGLLLDKTYNKLPRNNIKEASALYGYANNINKFIEEAKKSENVEDEDTIRNATGHWYGEFYLPSTTKIAFGKETNSNDVVSNHELLLKDGYIIVVFDKIETSYLSYSKPDAKTRWEKEGATYAPYEIKLPNGNVAQIESLNEGVAMAIYEVAIRANDDYGTEGTH